MFDTPNALYTPEYRFQAGTYRLDVGDRFYIGSTTKFGARQSSHLAALRRGVHQNQELQAAWSETEAGTFTILKVIPPRDHDGPSDHAQRLLFHEHLAIQEATGNPKCCNTRDLSSFSPELAADLSEFESHFSARNSVFYAAKRRFERLVRPGPTSRGPRKHSAETRCKMSAAKQGASHPKARACFLVRADGRREDFGCAADMARHLGVTPTVLHGWLTGAYPWPGSGTRPPNSKYVRLSGISGGYLENRKKRPEHLDRSKKLIEVELIFAGSEPRRFSTIHSAAKAARVSHLTLYLWLLGERPWPEGLTGRAITPL